MTLTRRQNVARRVADLQLRGSSGWLRPRLHWPVPPVGAAALLVAFGVPGATCSSLCARTGVVVLAVDLVGLDDATSVLGWAADHARELDADPGALLVAGAGPGTALARDVTRRARESGWPPVRAELRYDSARDAAEYLPVDVACAASCARTDEIRRGLTS